MHCADWTLWQRSLFSVLQIMCQIAYLKYWQKNAFSCRDPWLKVPLQWANCPLKWANHFPCKMSWWPWAGMTQTHALPVPLWDVYHKPLPTQEAQFAPVLLNPWQSKWENGGASALPRILFCYVPSSSQCVTPARDLHWQGWGTQDSQLPLNFMVFTEICFQVGWNLANVSLFTTFSNSDQHLKSLLYTAVFLGMVSTGSLEYGRAETILNSYLSFGIKEKVLRAPDLCFQE